MCQSCIPQISIDMAKAEAFAGEMVSIINHGALSTMISIGHRSGLFDVMDRMPPATCAAIAKTAELHERYVREWLAAMVTGKIIDYDPKTGYYELPAENAMFLTRKANENNMAVIASLLPVWTQAEDQVLDCFKNGGGVPYDQFPRFHEVMGEVSDANVGRNFVEKILPDHPDLLKKLQDGIRVLDIGCGDGQILIKLAKTFPNSIFTGADLCPEPIAAAQELVEQQGLRNIEFKAVDLTDYLPARRFDLITAFDVIHDLARPDLVLDLLYQWLKDDGLFLMMDVNASSKLENNLENPFAPFLYSASTLHCMTVSLAQGGLGLGTVWGRELAQEMLGKAGFKKIDIRNYEHDLLDSYFFCSKI